MRNEKLVEALRRTCRKMKTFSRRGALDGAVAIWVDEIESALQAHAAEAVQRDVLTKGSREHQADMLMARTVLRAVVVPPAKAAQAQNVPGELAEPIEGAFNYEQKLAFTEGWNACREAMLAAAPQQAAELVRQFRVVPKGSVWTDVKDSEIWASVIAHPESYETRVLYTHPQPAQDAKDAEVYAEIERATAKFPTWPTDPLHAVSVLGEEYGELVKATLQHTYEPHKSDLSDVREEAVQTAAMALRFVRSIDRYEFARCKQHSQDSAPGRPTPSSARANASNECPTTQPPKPTRGNHEHG